MTTLDILTPDTPIPFTLTPKAHAALDAPYTAPLCPGDDPGADWQEMGWCCRECAALAHLAWCPNHPPADDEPVTADSWSCGICGAAYFGTPPDDALCDERRALVDEPVCDHCGRGPWSCDCWKYDA